MNMDLILLEEFRQTNCESSSLSGVARTMNSDLRRWVAENLKKQLGGEEDEAEEPAGMAAVSCEKVAV